MRVLVVDDDPAVSGALNRALRLEGYEVSLAVDGPPALEEIAIRPPDAVILDIGLPTIDGLDVCRRLRAADNDTPVLMLTARDAINDRVQGLDAGADDYLVKPFALAELLARLRALLRRRPEDVGRRAPLRRPHPRPDHPGGPTGRPPVHPDPHRVRPARTAAAPSRARC